ncbi:Ribosomal RNA-processing protein 14 [Ceratocystis platani]|uniref:Ribosomal RNA-processing protein 14 n=1 Tax=Ceratocystis fimbriata f. sp. platani TaxID=88771 RepID=A0A0F8D9K8_CERFI|nr:Ribosomal RNA-processing protein 14 [Ceratocystis platani]
MAESLEDRIRDHAAAFNGLLSLIPSKLYYGADATANTTAATDDAGIDPHNNKKKKKTKAEKKAAKKARLDPDNDANRSAKDVMDEAGRKKRKLQELEEEATQAEEYEEVEGIEPEKPREGLKETKERTKKVKVDGENKSAATTSEPAAADETKVQKKSEKLERKKQKAEQKKATKIAKTATTPATADTASSAPKSAPKKTKTSETKDDEWTDVETSMLQSPASESKDTSNIPAPSTEESSTMTSGSSSNDVEESQPQPTTEKPRLIKVPKDTAEFRERFAAKMAALRAARFKENNMEGKPVRTRHELIESRRAKQIARKAHKKEQRQAAKRAEEVKREEALASNSPQILSPPGMELELNDTAANLSFGRVAFGDGSQLSHDLSYSLSRDSKKGPSDPKTALLKLQNAKKRLAAMTPEKRAEIEDKEAWLTARRRAEGEKIRDDELSLKKAVKRKERVKKRSEREWDDRLKGVEKAKADKQKKRETNLRKRIDDKLQRKLEKGTGKKRSKSGGAKKKSRPGFEGSSFGKKK